MCYLFVHFRERVSPDGEQVYFGLSRDGFRWEAVNEGRPVLWAYHGDMGVRDMTVVRSRFDGRVHIFATDLSLSYGMRNQYHRSWEEIGRHGRRDLAHWVSEDLVTWSEQELISVGDEPFGCMWAPDVLWDEARGEYILHFTASHAKDDFRTKCIWAVRTKDFEHFSAPYEWYRKPDSDVIDSAAYEEDGRYYLFVKSPAKPSGVILLSGDTADGPWKREPAFEDKTMKDQGGKYEAPTALRLPDGRWCLFMDYFGAFGRGQGYVPFVGSSLKTADFVRSEGLFEFPYRFKHGTVLPISGEEYERIRAAEWKVD